MVSFAIITDGLENASRNTTKKDVEILLKSHYSRKDWKFYFVVKEKDYWIENFGIPKDNRLIEFDVKIPLKGISALGEAMGADWVTPDEPTGRPATPETPYL